MPVDVLSNQIEMESSNQHNLKADHWDQEELRAKRIKWM